MNANKDSDNKGAAQTLPHTFVSSWFRIVVMLISWLILMGSLSLVAIADHAPRWSIVWDVIEILCGANSVIFGVVLIITAAPFIPRTKN